MKDERVDKLIEIIKELAIAGKEMNHNLYGLQQQISFQQEQIRILTNQITK